MLSIKPVRRKAIRQQLLAWLPGSILLGAVLMAITLFDPRWDSQPAGWATLLSVGLAFPVGGIGLALLLRSRHFE
ncbi:MAG TPA: hypothetical protein VFA95_05915 [Gammaproteobacteria bacterium]|nr:hypothetical protein [Gammaproteobacteria bacterium]